MEPEWSDLRWLESDGIRNKHERLTLLCKNVIGRLDPPVSRYTGGQEIDELHAVWIKEVKAEKKRRERYCATAKSIADLPQLFIAV